MTLRRMTPHLTLAPSLARFVAMCIVSFVNASHRRGNRLADGYLHRVGKRAAWMIALPIIVGLVGIPPASATIAVQPRTDTWGTNGRVWALARSGSTIYLGGAFTQALGPGGQSVPRVNLEAIEQHTGKPGASFATNPN